MEDYASFQDQDLEPRLNGNLALVKTVILENTPCRCDNERNRLEGILLIEARFTLPSIIPTSTNIASNEVAFRPHHSFTASFGLSRTLSLR